MRAPRSLSVLATTASLLVLAGCGGTSEVPEVASATAPPPGRSVPTVDPGPSLTCGGLAFDALTLRTGGGEPGELGPPITAALEALVGRHPLDRPAGLPERGVTPGDWMLLAVEGGPGARMVEVATGDWSAKGPGSRAMTVSLQEHRGGSLKVTGWGDCPLLEPTLDAGRSWVDVYRPDKGFDRKARTLTVLVSERQCASARRPGPYLHEPMVLETEKSVTISWTSDAVLGGAACPSNPFVRRAVELAAPLGDRVVLDGSYWPAREVAESH